VSDIGTRTLGVVPTPRAESRIADAEALLAAEGLGSVHVRAEGPQQEILALRAGTDDDARLLDLVPQLKALGFRYIALDLQTSEDL
jgi:hypothetical protein